MIFLRSKPATTLVEILLYFVLLAVVMLALLTFSIQIGDLYGETANYYEVDYASTFVHEQLEASFLKATGIDGATTTTGVSEGSIGLTVSVGANSPTRFYMSGGVLYMKLGAGTATAITPDTVQVDSFMVTRLTTTIGGEQIQLDGSFSAAGVDRNEMAVTQAFHWTFTLRTL